jgi:hypothetical protein
MLSRRNFRHLKQERRLPYVSLGVLRNRNGEVRVPFAQPRRGHWARKEIPLYLGRTKSTHLLERVSCFYSFDYRFNAELLRDGEGRTDDRLAPTAEITNERLLPR